MTDPGESTSGTRRQFLRTVGVAGLTTTAVGSVSAGDPSSNGETSSSAQRVSMQTSGNAPMLRYDATNSGVTSSSVPQEGVEAAWAFETGDAIRTQPVLANGTIYVASTDSYLYAIDAATGDERWSRQHDSALTTGPVVSGGIVYVPTDGRLVAYSAATGSGQFVVNADERVGTPTIAGGTLYTRIGHSLQAIDAADGTREWTTDLSSNEATDTQRNLAVTVTDDSVYVADGAKTGTYSDRVEMAIRKLARTDGTQEWRNDIRSFSHERDPPFDTTITAHDGSLYFGAVDAVRVFDAADGSGQWTFSSIGNVRTYPTVDDQTVFATASDGLYAIDSTVGTSMWSTEVPGRPTSPVLASDTLVFGSTDNNAYAFDRTGSQLWSFTTGSGIVAPPVAVDGMVYVASTDGSVYALSAADSVSAPDVTGDGTPATDPDGDGLYEDVNGDGEFSIVDVQALFANLDSEAVQSNSELFDFNGDGQVDVTDVQALFAALQEQ